MLSTFTFIENISKYFSSVLITGETGTGKEITARAIHTLSETKNKKFVICDCASIPQNLFESELFGYVKGAFTGADKDKKGLFEEANGGIIFLDEIGEIQIPTQAKLLRALENRHFRPLGSNENKHVEVKVIAATNKDLREGIKKGTFRDDLFHRLNKVEINLPPLRKRQEDIPLLIRHFLNKYSKKFFIDIKGVSRKVQKLFLRYEWSGNVRELENVLERASMLTKKDFIDIGDLPEYFQDTVFLPEITSFNNKNSHISLGELEREYIGYLLGANKNNLRKTAGILNVSRTTLI
ncbi:sigma-54 interaction domain-containing protein [Acidobacteriota bacterium]